MDFGHTARLFWIIDNLHKNDLILGTQEWTPKKIKEDKIILPTKFHPFINKLCYIDLDY